MKVLFHNLPPCLLQLFYFQPLIITFKHQHFYSETCCQNHLSTAQTTCCISLSLSTGFQCRLRSRPLFPIDVPTCNCQSSSTTTLYLTKVFCSFKRLCPFTCSNPYAQNCPPPPHVLSWHLSLLLQIPLQDTPFPVYCWHGTGTDLIEAPNWFQSHIAGSLVEFRL